MKMLNNYYTEPPVHRETAAASFAAPSAAAASFTAPSAAAASFTAPSAETKLLKYTWADKTLPEQKIKAIKYQENLDLKIKNEMQINGKYLTLQEKADEIETFLNTITFFNWPKELARTSRIMNFCEDNEKLCKGLQEKYPWFNKFMNKFKSLDDHVPGKTCDNNDINRILSRIISEDNVVSDNLDKVAKEIAFATASNLVKKDSAKTKTEIKRKEEKKNKITENIFEQLQTCGYHADTNNYFRLDKDCCFTEPPYKGGSVSDITIKDGEIVHTNNVNEKKLNAAIEFVEKTIDLKSLKKLTTEQLMEQINKITTENNITISEEDKNIITIHSNIF